MGRLGRYPYDNETPISEKPGARKYEVAGIGLPLSKRLAELHGGTLELEFGRGTTVTVTFPTYRLVGEKVAA